jgi:hypothetical protein
MSNTRISRRASLEHRVRPTRRVKQVNPINRSEVLG